MAFGTDPTPPPRFARSRLKHNLTAQPDASRDLTHVSVIVPTYNDAEHLALTVQRVTEQGRLRAIWLVDRGSTDATISIGSQFAERSDLNVHIISCTPTPAEWPDESWQLQQAIRLVDSAWVAIVRPGVELLPYALATLAHQALQHQLAWSVLVPKQAKPRWRRLVTPIADYVEQSPGLVRYSKRKLQIAMARTDELQKLRGFSPATASVPPQIASSFSRAGLRTWWGRSTLARDTLH